MKIKISVVLTIAVLISTVSIHADQQWESLGYSKGKGAIDNRLMTKLARDTIFSCQFSALGGSLK